MHEFYMYVYGVSTTCDVFFFFVIFPSHCLFYIISSPTIYFNSAHFPSILYDHFHYIVFSLFFYFSFCLVKIHFFLLFLLFYSLSTCLFYNCYKRGSSNNEYSMEIYIYILYRAYLFFFSTDDWVLMLR